MYCVNVRGTSKLTTAPELQSPVVIIRTLSPRARIKLISTTRAQGAGFYPVPRGINTIRKMGHLSPVPRFVIPHLCAVADLTLHFLLGEETICIL